MGSLQLALITIMIGLGLFITSRVLMAQRASNARQQSDRGDDGGTVLPSSWMHGDSTDKDSGWGDSSSDSGGDGGGGGD